MHHKVRKEQERKERKPIEGVETKSATWAICEGNRMPQWKKKTGVVEERRAEKGNWKSVVVNRVIWGTLI